MTKVKHVRTADCVVAGFRWHKSGPIVGSLLLGLYNDAGDLQHIGVAASFPMARRAELVEELAPYRANALDGPPLAGLGQRRRSSEDGGEHRMPGAVSRWNAKKDLSWVPLRPELVVEIKYDQLEGRRLRHTGQFLRWRPDRERAELHLRPAGRAGALRPGRGAGRLSVPRSGAIACSADARLLRS